MPGTECVCNSLEQTPCRARSSVMLSLANRPAGMGWQNCEDAVMRSFWSGCDVHWTHQHGHKTSSQALVAQRGLCVPCYENKRPACALQHCAHRSCRRWGTGTCEWAAKAQKWSGESV